MASTKEIKKELTIALNEIGRIKPWFDEEMGDWGLFWKDILLYLPFQLHADSEGVFEGVTRQALDFSS